MSYNCEILSDSLNPQGDRLTTMKITFPRFILAEFNTHRMFSRNSASSRAIPFDKMVKMVEENPFIPIAWQKDHRGMQGTEYSVNNKLNKALWLAARDEAVRSAKALNKESDVTKQLCNRLLEPFMWHTVIVTATEWENFFKLRCPEYSWQGKGSFRSWKDLVSYHFNKGASRDWVDGLENADLLIRLFSNISQAEIHIQAIAELMWDSYNDSKPKQLQAGEWHTPFGGNIDLSCSAFDEYKYTDRALTDSELDQLRVKVSTARCARISYETLGDNPKIDYAADIRLHDILKESGHWSPFEHCAKSMTTEQYSNYVRGVGYDDWGGTFSSNQVFDKEDQGWCNNFRGFIQYRYLIEK